MKKLPTQRSESMRLELYVVHSYGSRCYLGKWYKNKQREISKSKTVHLVTRFFDMFLARLKTSMVYVCNAWVYFQRDRIDTYRPVVCWLTESALSRKGIIYKRLMQINEMARWPWPWGTALTLGDGLDGLGFGSVYHFDTLTMFLQNDAHLSSRQGR